MTSLVGKKLTWAEIEGEAHARERKKREGTRERRTHAGHDVPPGLLKVLVLAVEVELGLHARGDAFYAEGEPWEAFAEEGAEAREVAVRARGRVAGKETEMRRKTLRSGARYLLDRCRGGAKVDELAEEEDGEEDEAKGDAWGVSEHGGSVRRGAGSASGGGEDARGEEAGEI